MTTTFHVSGAGDDADDGSAERPVRTVSAAAARAHAGDTILVGAGTYRERIDPPRGGTEDSPITYTAVPSDHVVLTGSDRFENWSRVDDGLWRLVIPNRYFGDFNPYAEVVHGDWFVGNDRRHRRGNIFLDGAWLPEVPSLDALETGIGLGWSSTVDGLQDRPIVEVAGIEGHAAYAPAVYDLEGVTTITARLPAGTDPNIDDVEVSVRATVFTPTAEHIDHITVRGFEIRNAATNWVAPTVGQEGMVTAYWSRGWVIEDNEICYSRCAGIALAKNRDEFDGERGTTDGYYLTIQDALERDGWSRETIGSHVIRNNKIHHCGQVGIVGSLGCAFSVIEGNEIHDCNAQGIWTGWEMAGIKLHGAIDVVIRGNHLYRCGEPAAIWLDWMAQGTRLVDNLMHDNVRDVFTEVNHGPIQLVNNIMLSRRGLLTNSRGMLVAHNLILGRLEVWDDERETPYLRPHSTLPVSMRRVCSVGDAHWVNNILGDAVDLSEYDKSVPDQPCTFSGNVTTASEESRGLVTELAVDLERVGDVWRLAFLSHPDCGASADRVRRESLGVAVVPQQVYIDPDATSTAWDHDYMGVARGDRVAPGPFHSPLIGAVAVWPRRVAV
ncbi:right-handed parallel beta-helix repeat-containing protein [Microbacterium rhizosphaerae]|uniref:Right-handed parallel beta-helix repeat-containing protein n=1 Tax=Microbacterium rhizosphaerae TaxID=1678237 RepID=A0ABZ0SIE7_9MICO|nr:right-handed parallel beta-helix repeat-containing protein [Microbacterium rhizosphaerae]WPR89111.1 right-handed parallel beta-helix repeat-containing protein [Microbacterium rhizosphaerae]